MFQTNQLTDEIEDLWKRIATIDGWINIEKKEGGGFIMFWGEQLIRNPKRSFFSVPDYPSDQNAIATLFKERNLYYQVAWMPSRNCARANGIYDLEKDVEVIGETEAIALCKLFLVLQENK